MTKENPYITMEQNVLEEHLKQVAEVMDQKKISTVQFFGESLTEETQAKLAENASLTAKVKNLEETQVTTLSPETEKLAKLNIDNAVASIKAIDENFPIQGILDSSLNSFDKIDMLNQMKISAEYSKKSVDAIKEALPNTDKVQGFGSAPNTNLDDADKIVASLAEKAGIEV